MITITKIVLAVVSILRGLMDYLRSAQDRQAGRDEVIADQARQKDERLAEAMKAEVEAEKDHKTMPGDEAFDTEFRRD